MGIHTGSKERLVRNVSLNRAIHLSSSSSSSMSVLAVYDTYYFVSGRN